MKLPTSDQNRFSNLMTTSTSRRSALKTLGGMAGLALFSQFGLGCGSDDDPTGPGPAPSGDPLVLLVPGFMSQLYKAFSIYGETLINAALRNAALQVPVIGDRIADLLPTIDLPVPAGGFITFDSLKAYYDAEGVAYVEMPQAAGFNTQQGVVRNGAAIAEFLKGLDNKSVTILSHSKGGLDTLQALLENRDLWGTTVQGWVALQAPFRGSPVADNLPSALAGPVLNAFGGDRQALDDLKTAGRGQYMLGRANAIAELTGTIPVTSAYSTFTTSPSQSIQNAAWALAEAVFNSGMLRDIAAIVAANLLNPAQAAAEAVALIRTRARQLVGGVMSDVPMMGLSNLTMPEANDGLVPVSSAALAGAGVFQMNPQGDHAAPVMEVTPFKNFWTAGYRNEVTSGQVEDVRGPKAVAL
jgi:triacylglycerol esterase/lipase EstA (alpha/beta hydrolase family)